SGAAGQISVGGFTLAQLGGGTASGRTPEGVDRSLEVYSLKFALPFWPAMKQLCKQQNLELEADTDELVAAGIDLAQVVSVEVKNASLERIFQEIANAAGCEARLVGNKVIVKAKK
ncbi:MAG: STN domain-containing protein, partial [Thermoguttaceae bacterium]|nr:STN domain-containing protein [Thermoguttaceae bacterium]